MSSRRDFVQHAAAAALAAWAPFSSARVSNGKHRSNPLIHKSRIRSVRRREETLTRREIHGDQWSMTWGADDRQYLGLMDGLAWPQNSKLYNSRLLSIVGNPLDAIFEDVPSYPELLNTGREPFYFGTTALSIEERIYQYLCTLRGGKWIGAKLIYSPDSGRSWCNQDGSSPVRWEPVQEQSRRTLIFFDESQEAFSLLSILQMGRNYAANRDGFVYGYAPNGNTDGTMNELVMFRVAKSRILDRSAYEYFCGRRSNGAGRWSKDIEARKPVHTFPRGWVNTVRDGIVAQSWLPSVAYNPALDLYMMVNWGNGLGPEGRMFGKPSYLGIYIAPHPWGPWTQVHEESAWCPGGDIAARAYVPQIAPKWIAEDGKSFWLVWSDFQQQMEKAEAFKKASADLAAREDLTSEEKAHLLQRAREAMRTNYYRFNAQRVDLTVT